MYVGDITQVERTTRKYMESHQGHTFPLLDGRVFKMFRSKLMDQNYWTEFHKNFMRALRSENTINIFDRHRDHKASRHKEEAPRAG